MVIQERKSLFINWIDNGCYWWIFSQIHWLGLMKDPVIAADGLSYDRQTMTKWFATQPIRGRQSTSVQNWTIQCSSFSVSDSGRKSAS